MVECLVFGILLAAIGAFMFFKPHILWKITEQWKTYRGDEPSDMYVASTKFGGIAFAVVGIVIAVLPWILE